MTTKLQEREAEEARERLLNWIEPGDEIRCVLRHVSRSGMLRVIDLLKLEASDDDAPRVLTIGWNAALAMGARYDRDREGIRISGCGMDMGFALVYNLGRLLWPEGFKCIGEHCPANDHLNGDYDYTPSHVTHRDGGYALRHRWI